MESMAHKFEDSYQHTSHSHSNKLETDLTYRLEIYVKYSTIIIVEYFPQ